MNNALDEFYSTKNLQDLLDEDSSLTLVPELVDFFKANQDLVLQMIAYFRYDELDTDYKTSVKYPFLCSEILSKHYFLDETSIAALLRLLETDSTLPSIVIGYIAKAIMNILKHEPVKFWHIVTVPQLHVLVREVNIANVAETLYATLVFQIEDSQCELISRRLEFFDYLLSQITSEVSDGIAQILQLILQQVSEQVQEQKLVIVRHFFSKLDVLLSNLLQKPRDICEVLWQAVECSMISQVEKENLLSKLKVVLGQPEVGQMLQDGSKIFGMEKLSLLILLEKVSRKTDLIEPFEIATMLLGLMKQYPLHNQMHKWAAQTIENVLPSLNDRQRQELENKSMDTIRLKQPNRPYLVNLVTKLQITINEEIDLINKLNNTYLLDVVPEQRTMMNIQEDYEEALSKFNNNIDRQSKESAQQPIQQE